MAHHIYHTKGLILGSVAIGESNRFYKIFTEELGLIGASAQSVREGKSKLRYALQDYSWIMLDVVRGREVWRITSAIPDTSRTSLSGDLNKQKVFARIASLMLRLVHGEVRQDDLFRDILHIQKFLERESLPVEFMNSFEVLSALRIFARLGYISEENYTEVIMGEEYSLEILALFQRDFEKRAINDINKALRESHL